MFLTAVDGPSGRLATYVYDSESKRRRIYEGAAFTTIVWDGWDYLQWRRPSGTHVFHTMNGEIVGESVGGVVRDYLLDPLGSVVATLDSDGLVDQFEYWPYGELVGDVPEGAPVFLWVGGLGYWFDADERRYVRHRMLRTDLGSWMQLDPLWPVEAAFHYSGRRPVSISDKSGLRPATLEPCRLSKEDNCRGSCTLITNAYADRFKKFGNKFDQCASCVSSFICTSIRTADGFWWWGVAQSIADGLACQNECMARKWRERTTPLWERANRLCGVHGETSKICCLANVDAEQDGFTQCARECSLALNLIPEDARRRFAKDVLKCCD